MAGRPLNEPNWARLFVLMPDVKVALCLTPKVASTSIIKALMAHYGIEDAPPYHLNPALASLTLPQVQEYVPGWRRAMFVRNPFDRLLANYLYHVKDTNLQNSANMRRLGFHVGMKLGGFLAKVVENTEADPHYAQQCWQTDRIDFAARIEDEDAWQRFREFSGLDLPELSRSNIGAQTRGHYREHYSPAWSRTIAEAYRHDLREFGYEF